MQGLMMEYPLTVDRILEHACRMHGGKEIVTKLPDGSLHRYRYADLYRRVKRLANVLEALGVRPGDRVGTFAWNNHEHLELYYAIPVTGAVIHTLNIRVPAEQLAYIVEHAGDRVIFIDGTLLPLFERIAPQVSCVERYVLYNVPASTETSLPNVSHLEALLSEAGEDYTWRVTDESSAMGLCYTSGTTGNPKGVLYSHRSVYLHSLASMQTNALGLGENDVVLPVVPMFHAMAWGLPYSCAMAGAGLVLPGPHLQPAPLAELIASEQVTIPAGVPTIWTGLYHELEAHPRDLSHVRSLIVGGSAMPRALIEAYEKELGIPVTHAWGMTETSPLGSVCNLRSHHRNLSETERWDVKARQGYAPAGIEMRIVNDAGEELPWDGTTMGELQVRGPWVARAYFKMDPSPEHFTPDGWFRTGDVATIAPDGCMNITDRTKDLVKSGGEWISSVALENAIMSHPAVREAAVIAIPDEKWGERPLAVVVPTSEDSGLTAEAIRNHIRPHFEKYWLPDRVVFLEEIPKTSVGKFDKKRLRQWHAEGRWGA